jgi:hypothetical protein
LNFDVTDGDGSFKVYGVSLLFCQLEVIKQLTPKRTRQRAGEMGLTNTTEDIILDIGVGDANLNRRA